MKITGTIVNYYYHCPRKCYLFANKINLENNSEDVRIGKIMHEIKAENNKNAEIKLESISIDKITDKYVIEMKKSDSDIGSARIQVLLYLQKLKEKGIIREGKLVFNEKNTNENVEIIKLDDISQLELDKCIMDINNLLSEELPPEPKMIKGCKKCAYYEYCFL